MAGASVGDGAAAWEAGWLAGAGDAAPPHAPRTSTNPTIRATMRDVPLLANLRFSNMVTDSSNSVLPTTGVR